MTRIAFLGAGSTVFARNILGDVLLREGLQDIEIALYDIDRVRLEDSARLVEAINRNQNQG
ncbi:MAG TPA: alpha-glucosidase/alpha-galactosidase, partial [Deltaproteobacteria bacterium]|nr:alpha-glucosidase/alpha-galactosidase [Deltaproteobacteria bacterium]